MDFFFFQTLVHVEDSYFHNGLEGNQGVCRQTTWKPTTVNFEEDIENVVQSRVLQMARAIGEGKINDVC